MNRTLLVLHAQGAVPADWWAPRLAARARVVTLYDEDVLDDPEREIDAIESVGLSFPFGGTIDARAAVTTVLEGHDVAGVLTFSELLLPEVAEVAEARGLRHHSLDAVRRTQSKALQREAFARAGLPVPQRVVLRTTEDVHRAATDLRFPVVVKPVFGFGSVTTSLVTSPGQLADALPESAEAYRGDPRLAGRPPIFLAEEFIRGALWHPDRRMGDHVSVESLLVDGTPLHLTVTDKFPLEPPFRETGDIMPSWLSTTQVTEVLAVTDRALGALGLTAGAAHTELKLTERGPVVIEVNCRVGGNIPRVMENACGYDLVGELASLALGDRPRRPQWKAGRYAGGYHFLTPPSDVRILEINGSAQARTLPDVIRVTEFGVGRVPAWRLGGGHYAYVEAVATEPSRLLALREDLQHVLSATVVPVARAPDTDVRYG